MAFIVEDGSGKPDSNSYVDLDYAHTYFRDRGQSVVWECLSAEEKQGVLIRATDYIEAEYTWEGCATDLDQSLGWPRIDAYDHNRNFIDSDGIPARLKEAVCVLALELANRVNINAPVDRVTKREKAGPVEVEYMDGAASRRVYPQVDGLLRGLAFGGPGSVQVPGLRG